MNQVCADWACHCEGEVKLNAAPAMLQISAQEAEKATFVYVSRGIVTVVLFVFMQTPFYERVEGGVA